MGTINLNIQTTFKKKCFLEKEAKLKANIVLKLKLSKKYEKDITKKLYIEKEITLLTKRLDDLYK